MTTDNVVAMKTVPKSLYSVSSVAAEFPHRHGLYKDVTISWFVNNRAAEFFEPARIIVGWADMDEESQHYAWDCAFELMTLEEAEQLKSFLESYPTVDEVEEHKLPLTDRGNCLPMGAIPVGGGTDFYMLWKAEDYKLPFSVSGYFDTRENTLLHLLPCEGCGAEKPRDVYGLWIAEMKRSKYLCETCFRAAQPNFAQAVINRFADLPF